MQNHENSEFVIKILCVYKALYKPTVGKNGAAGSITKTECPVKKRDCAGCAEWSGGHCTKLQGGFVNREEMEDGTAVDRAVACTSAPGWTTAEGNSCDHPSVSCGSTASNNGLTPAQACCKCANGGQTTATPFEWVSHPVAVGWPKVSGWPEPRTASMYSINEDCDLGEYGLTIDGTTGQLQGVPKTDEPSKIECEITALQLECEGESCKMVASPHSAKVVVEVSYMAYPANTLLCHEGVSSTHAPVLAGRDRPLDVTWSEFTIDCVPTIPWLANNHFNRTNGEITCPATSTMAGSVTDVDDVWLNQPGGVCTISAKQRDASDAEAKGKPKVRTTSVVLLQPRPWTELEYSTYTATATVGEMSPVLTIQPPSDKSGPGWMAPTKFTTDCYATPTSVGSGGTEQDLTFTYDQLTNTGAVAGFPVFELSEDGSLSAMPADGLLSLFNKDESTNVRKSITLTCDIFGLYPDPTMSAVKSKQQVKLTLTDDICWIRQNLAVAQWGSPIPSMDAAKCRAACRHSPMCALYSLDASNHCKFFYRKFDQASGKQDVWAKVTDCTNDRII